METALVIIKVVGIVLATYIGINRFLHYIDGDIKNK